MEWEYSTNFDIKHYEGFVYLITNLLTNKKYIGKKSFWTRQKDKKTGRRKTKESTWKNYFSSSEELKADVKTFGKQNFRREILHLCVYKKQMSYWETRLQWIHDVLGPMWYNTNIEARYFTNENYIYNMKPKELEHESNS